MHEIKRFRHNGWFIQSRKSRNTGDDCWDAYTAWSSKRPSNDPIASACFGGDEVYFEFGLTEIEAITKLTKELDCL